ncbi:MAG TPA: hypothetical protein VGF24_05055 [Vicinamibacterales bacterium]|jgi:hypothetical protein
MTFRYTSRTLLGAAAMAAISASLSAAQTGPTSTRRIPISKEATGGVARIDTVTVYKTDTLRVTDQLPGRVDTVRNTVIRIDTVAPVAPPARLPGGMYFGVAGGVTAPNGALHNTNVAGPTFQGQLGWQGAKNLLGVRADVNYAQPGEDARFAALQENPRILNFSADAKLQLPFFTDLMGANHRFALYGIGGYTHTMYKNLPIRLNGQTAGGGMIVGAGSSDWQHENGWNAGGGASLGWGRTELFLESRLLSFKPDNAAQARQIPFMLGINFY